jgi:hypothetical protein
LNRQGEKTYAVLYLRPDGYWIAGEGWASKTEAAKDSEDQLPAHVTRKIVLVGGKPYREAKELEAQEVAPDA